MSKLTEQNNLDEVLTQGSTFQEKKFKTLGTFTELEGIDKKKGSVIEFFLPESLQTTGDGVNDGVIYSDVASTQDLFDYFMTKKNKLKALISDLNKLDVAEVGKLFLHKDPDASDMAPDNPYWFKNADDAEYKNIINLKTGETTPTDSIAFGSGGVQDSINLTCAGIRVQTDDFPTGLDYATPAGGTIDADVGGVCSPFLNDDGKFEETILLITQMREILEELKTRDDDDPADAVMTAKVELDDIVTEYEQILEYKNVDNSSSAYLETEKLKHDSSELLYIMLLLGTLTVGSITVFQLAK